jgi:hypothetical protein
VSWRQSSVDGLQGEAASLIRWTRLAAETYDDGNSDRGRRS